MSEAAPPDAPDAGAGSFHPQFLRGYEAGRIAARIQLLGHVTLRETVRPDNEDLVRELATTAGRRCQTDVLDDDRTVLVIDPVRGAERPTRPARLGPKVVRFGSDEPIVSTGDAPTYGRATLEDRGRDE